MSKLSFSSDMFNPDTIQVHNEDNEHIGDYTQDGSVFTAISVTKTKLSITHKASMLVWLEKEYNKKVKKAVKQEKSQTILYELL